MDNQCNHNDILRQKTIRLNGRTFTVIEHLNGHIRIRHDDDEMLTPEDIDDVLKIYNASTADSADNR